MQPQKQISPSGATHLLENGQAMTVCRQGKRI
jgi:hypothetical protein